MKEKVEEILNSKIRPFISAHGGDIQVAAIADGGLTIRLTGQCQHCPSAGFTTRQMVKEVLMSEIPEITDVELEEYISPELLLQARKLLFGTTDGA